MHLTRNRISIGIGLVILGIGLALLLPQAKVFFDEATLINYLKLAGPAAAAVFVAVFAFTTVLGIPGTILTIAGGAFFGLFWGTVWSVLGATIGAIGAFWVARTLLHSWAKRRFGQHHLLVRLNQAVLHRPFYFVLAVRFTPISPFSVMNFLFGLTPIDLKSYTLGTFVGLIPGILAYSWVGASGSAVLRGGDRTSFFLALTFLALLSIIPMMKKKPAVD